MPSYSQKAMMFRETLENILSRKAKCQGHFNLHRK
jgi:hypothetical protein